LLRLDRLIERGLRAAQSIYGPAALEDPFRGLHISPQDVFSMISRPPGAPLLFRSNGDFDYPRPGVDLAGGSRLAWLAKTFGLSPFELDVVLIALGPEVDLRYERLYAYLQDDVTRKRPRLDLALNLLCASTNEKLRRRESFKPDAPLLRNGVLHLLPDPGDLQPPLLAHVLVLDDLVVRALLGPSGLDRRLAPFCRLIQPTCTLEGLALHPSARRALQNLVDKNGQTPGLYFYGPSGSGKRGAAEALAIKNKSLLLEASLPGLLAFSEQPEALLHLLLRQAGLLQAVLYLNGLDRLFPDHRSAQLDGLLSALAGAAGITIASGEAPWIVKNQAWRPVPVAFPLPDALARRQSWERSLAENSLALDPGDLNRLAARYRLTPGAIAAAVGEAQVHSRWLHPAGASRKRLSPALLFKELSAAARRQSRAELGELAQRVELRYGWEDLVLPEDSLTQLRELCARVDHRGRVLEEWGFARELATGQGVAALFAGPPGTGKTMAAEVIAAELELDLYRIDLSGVVSKYIGETEKNLRRIFDAAAGASAILFFDEADALFGRRSEVRDSHDRYANIEVSYLLQQMEQHPGVAILATNLREHLDEAFLRRLSSVILFPLPDEDQRRKIWQRIWPGRLPLDQELDLNWLARHYRLSGGEIRNVAVGAAYLAAAGGGEVSFAHLQQAARREFEKNGQVFPEADMEKELG
jgi:SpoVK/Ycf46/Vps4 family AAA+-type ATPase